MHVAAVVSFKNEYVVELYVTFLQNSLFFTDKTGVSREQAHEGKSPI